MGCGDGIQSLDDLLRHDPRPLTRLMAGVESSERVRAAYGIVPNVGEDVTAFARQYARVAAACARWEEVAERAACTQ